VLALIDGDAYPFDETLVASQPLPDSGRTAAQLCYSTLADQIRRLGLAPETDIVVRYVVNLATASTDLHRINVVGSHSRALASFTAAFSKRRPLFDVIDIGERPSGTEDKIAGKF